MTVPDVPAQPELTSAEKRVERQGLPADMPMFAASFYELIHNVHQFGEHWSWRCGVSYSRVDAGYLEGACGYDHVVGSWDQLVVDATGHLARWHNILPIPNTARTDARIDEAAADLCAAWIDATLILPAGVGKHAQFDALTEDGRDVWRGLVHVVDSALGPDPAETTREDR